MRIGWLVRDWDDEDPWTFVDGDNPPYYYFKKKMIVYDFIENVDD